MTSPLTGIYTQGLKGAAESSDYPKNWGEISKAFRKMHGYKCHACGVCCDQEAHHCLLDVHHINGVKRDCRDSNLRCLCKECHAKQDFHRHYVSVIKPEDKEALRQLRQEQNLPPPSE